MIDIDTLIKSPNLFRTEFPDGWMFEWRPLTLREYRIYFALRASNTIHPFTIYKMVFERCFIGDPKLLSTNMPMFLPMTMGHLIMYVSGDCNSETLGSEIQAARNIYISDDITEIMKRVIAMAFPRESYFDLEQLDRLELIDRFVKAEASLAYTTGGQYQPIDLSKLTQALPERFTEPSQPEFIDFDSENKEIIKSLNADERQQVDRLATNKLTPEQAKKLDGLKNRR